MDWTVRLGGTAVKRYDPKLVRIDCGLFSGAGVG
jgi:hypothetical protein